MRGAGGLEVDASSGAKCSCFNGVPSAWSTPPGMLRAFADLATLSTNCAPSMGKAVELEERSLDGVCAAVILTVA